MTPAPMDTTFVNSDTWDSVSYRAHNRGARGTTQTGDVVNLTASARKPTFENSEDDSSPVTNKSVSFIHSSPLPSKFEYTYEAFVADGNERKEFLLREEDASFNYLTGQILQEQQQHKLAAIHFHAVHDYALFIPSIAITCTSALLAILVKSTLVPKDKMQTLIAFVIAALSIFSAFLQAIMKQLDLSGRAGFHDSCETSLRRLRSFTLLNSREKRYDTIFKALKENRRPSVGEKLTNFQIAEEKEKRKEEGSVDTNTSSTAAPGNKDKDHTNSVDGKGKGNHAHNEATLTSQYRQAVDQCNSTVPINLSAAFNMLQARIELINKSTLKDKYNSKILWEDVMPVLYYQLSETIIQSKHWPLCIPEPEWTVTRTLEGFTQNIRNTKDSIVEVVLERGHMIPKADSYNMAGRTNPLRDDARPQTIMDDV
mmetsp:Transcript_32649/g.36370  ORF Transcript_32649/g.36370 Transcript_32649/m.36370 type:complete len:427 (+) Transcript_32649:73-1353(+)|eukprot:CAMPEP_0170817184 /NCGR_PEP_ID=MMETSP0733-20121128/39847_1 /TAXON_ID=186038 /ORGANISM="Fragilariopsis kerguelensis, Strain L26-C5" /LENGTH=426 /DNA_ID=CAMNT_0011176773 /DNA_START=73 /DNA_END=1353 /DNA_ORIENTATION=+